MLPENALSADFVGQLASKGDSGDTQTYSLTPTPEGDPLDNGKFAIGRDLDGSPSLFYNGPDNPGAQEWKVRIQVADKEGLATAKTFALTVAGQATLVLDPITPEPASPDGAPVAKLSSNLPDAEFSLPGVHAVVTTGQTAYFLCGNGQVHSHKNFLLRKPDAPNATETHPVFDHGVVAMDSAPSYALFLKSDGSVWKIGETRKPGPRGYYYETGQPEKVLDSGVVSISAGSAHFLFKKADGSLWGMGNNSVGQLGTDAAPNFPEPRKIIGNGTKEFVARYSHSLFTKEDGSLWGMGDNQLGRLGSGPTGKWIEPTMILEEGVTKVETGREYTIYTTSDGATWIMGEYRRTRPKPGEEVITRPPFRLPGQQARHFHSTDGYVLYTHGDGSLWEYNDVNTKPKPDTDNQRLPQQHLPAGVIGMAANRAYVYFIQDDGSLHGIYRSNIHKARREGTPLEGLFTPITGPAYPPASTSPPFRIVGNQVFPSRGHLPAGKPIPVTIRATSGTGQRIVRTFSLKTDAVGN